MTQLTELAATLAVRRARLLPGRRWLTRAAVAMVLAESPVVPELSILLMRRATRKGDPWSGHMSFPGGRMQRDDEHPRATARRETFEEVGLQLEDTDYVARLSDVVTRRHERPTPMIVSPYVFHCAQPCELKVNREGVEALWVPLSFLANPANRKQMRWKQLGVTWRLPCYDYEGRRIWGLTLIMLRELLRIYHKRA